MHLHTVRRIIIGVLLLVSAGLAAYVADLRWQDTLEGKVVPSVSVQLPNGDVQYGPYCDIDENGKRLEGGGICRVVEQTVGYTRVEALNETIGVAVVVMLVVGGLSWFVVDSIFWHVGTRRRNTRGLFRRVRAGK